MIDKHIHQDEFRLRILLTNQCNKDCYFCLNDFQPKEPPAYANMLNVNDCLRAYGTFMKSIKETSIVTFSGGEPGIYPGLDMILRHAKYYCDVVKVVTNGTALHPLRCKYVDCWHVGVTEQDQRVVDFREHAKDITAQIVVTEKMSMEKLDRLIEYYLNQGVNVKLFTDFFSDSKEMMALALFMSRFWRIETRFTGKQINRGAACEGCDKQCVTLKALWVFPDNTSSTCPQRVKEKYDDDSWDETVEKAYYAHQYREANNELH
jgi:organic radical activating enzyme